MHLPLPRLGGGEGKGLQGDFNVNLLKYRHELAEKILNRIKITWKWLNSKLSAGWEVILSMRKLKKKRRQFCTSECTTQKPKSFLWVSVILSFCKGGRFPPVLKAKVRTLDAPWGPPQNHCSSTGQLQATSKGRCVCSFLHCILQLLFSLCSTPEGLKIQN